MAINCTVQKTEFIVWNDFVEELWPRTALKYFLNNERLLNLNKMLKSHSGHLCNSGRMLPLFSTIGYLVITSHFISTLGYWRRRGTNPSERSRKCLCLAGGGA